jgi:hypothetical protein
MRMQPPIGALFGPTDRPVGAGTRRWKTMGVPDRWPNYSKVRFRSDQHRANGAPEGSVGYIVEVYDPTWLN